MRLQITENELKESTHNTFHPFRYRNSLIGQMCSFSVRERGNLLQNPVKTVDLPSMKSSLILHGHFYQPPRENPRTGIIDLQETASPYDDWNENIWDSCYRANAHSRYLDSDGAIRSIDNNYASISFNFGSTLLSWMQQAHPSTVRAIIEADKESVRRLGHGNAIAQGFNHTILPLDDPSDAELEIIWALDVFEKWFGRKSEGFWCPECAINPVVVDLLAKHGVKFVILSPWQCEAVEDEHGKMVSLEGKPAPCDAPFILTGPKGGEIAAFFYQPDLASGISFGHFLQNADTLYGKLVEMKRATGMKLIHTATDGEIYGHHEAYGDMALAALVKKVNEGDEFTLTNYGAYLADHPAKRHARLFKGEDGKGTSWSCSHGVSRWYKDCGCHTGGDPRWNQQWRTPLRDAFTQVHRIIMQKADGLSRKLLGVGLPCMVEKYAQVACRQTSLSDFISSLGPKAKGNEKEIASICLMVLYSMYSFTSCGWFFNDLGGIEPRQDIAYALYSIELYQELFGEDLHPLFLHILDKARCNEAKDGTGKTIAKAEDAALKGAVEASLFFSYGTIVGKGNATETYGKFHMVGSRGNTICLADCERMEEYHATYEPQSSSQAIALRVEDSHGKPLFQGTIGPEHFTKKMQKLFKELIAARLATMSYKGCEDFSDVITDYNQMASPSKDQGMDILEGEALGLSFVAIQSMMSQKTLASWEKMKKPFMAIVNYLARVQRQADRMRITSLLESWTHQMCTFLLEEGKIDEPLCLVLTDFFHVIRTKDVAINLTKIQETLWAIRPKALSPSFRLLLRELNFSEAIWRA